MPRRRRPPRAGALTELPPLKIAAQIAVLQCLYYAGAFLMLVFATLVAGHRFGMDLVFGWDVVRGDTTQGWIVAFIWLLNGGLFMFVFLSFFFPSSSFCHSLLSISGSFVLGLLLPPKEAQPAHQKKKRTGSDMTNFPAQQNV